MKPFFFERADICPDCGGKTLELYNMYNNPLHLSTAIDSGEESILQKLNARYFQCTKCHNTYPINWINNKPIPLTYNSFELFFESFKMKSRKQ